MKINLVCFKISKTLIILITIILIQILFITIELCNLKEAKNLEQMQKDVANIQNSEEESSKKEKVNTEDIKVEKKKNVEQKKPEEYKNIPRELKGYKVIGKIEIPKLNLNTYILNETNKKSLKVSVSKLYGPEINTIGNFCIAGHNYRNNKMFGGIKKLEIGDKIILTDTFDRSVTYKVYANYQVAPKDISSLAQNTEGERETTLITCTAGAIKRVIVKAVEDYD